MLKLYRIEDSKAVAYHEAWVHNSRVVEHWGRLGERGDSLEHRRKRRLSEHENTERILKPALANGFRQIDIGDHAVLLIEYAVEDMGTETDLEKRYELQDRMDETLGWTGLGACDGGSIGSGTMEVCCYVVNFEIAKRVIEEDLADTKFADYSQIYEEGAD